MPEQHWFIPGEVKQRNLQHLKRCEVCKTGPMFHPEHKWQPCWAARPGGEECGCTAGVR